MAIPDWHIARLNRRIRVIWFQANANSHDQHIALPGLFIAFTATFCWALYGVLIKRPSAELGSIRSFGVVSFITSTLLFPLTLAFGNIGTPLYAGVQANLVLVISAVICITLAHVFVLRCDPGNRSRAITKFATPLPSHRDGAVRLDLWRTTHPRATLERWHTADRCLSCNAHQTHRHDGNS
jgi:uncharacterized protein with PQ loop repeat